MLNIKKLAFSMVLGISILLNLGLGAYWFFDQSGKPKDRTGILVRDLEIGEFGSTKGLLTLPKGLTVKDETPRGLGQAGLFEPNRFSIFITADNEGLVDYSTEAQRLTQGNYYSAEISRNRDRETEVVEMNKEMRENKN